MFATVELPDGGDRRPVCCLGGGVCCFALGVGDGLGVGVRLGGTGKEAASGLSSLSLAACLGGVSDGSTVTRTLPGAGSPDFLVDVEVMGSMSNSP